MAAAGGAAPDGDVSAERARRVVPNLPEMMTFEIVIKTGQRKRVGGGSFELDMRIDGWAVFMHRIASLVNCCPVHTVSGTWEQEDIALRLEPSRGVNENRWLPLDEGSFHTCLSDAWRRSNHIRNILDIDPAHKWKVNVYVQKWTAPVGVGSGFARAMHARIAAARQRIDAHYSQQPEAGSPGVLERAYMTQLLARFNDAASTTIARPADHTGMRLRGIDSASSARTAANAAATSREAAPSEYMEVEVFLRRTGISGGASVTVLEPHTALMPHRTISSLLHEFIPQLAAYIADAPVPQGPDVEDIAHAEPPSH